MCVSIKQSYTSNDGERVMMHFQDFALAEFRSVRNTILGPASVQ